MKEQSPVELVRAGVDLVDIVSQYVTLKKAGRTFKAVCPFHSEKTPSFVVFPETGHWHCFGCGEGGDVFTFLMKIENLTFPEALQRLADRIGIAITHTREREETREQHRRLYAANEAAAIYYHGLLLNSTPIRAYVESRGITEHTVREFLLGLAPDGNDVLMRHLQAQGFTNDELLSAGLLYEPEDGPLRDRFRHRLMFPIRDAAGHIVSFGARVLAAGGQPKYLNGPQTDIFDKGGTLYGLHAGAQAIRKEHKAVIVEGYVDVVITHQAGFRNVVATLGTSITERHLRALAKLASEICLALDPDAAGENAALRSADVARAALTDAAVPIPTWRGLVRYEATTRASVTVAVLPDGLDPDELILRDPALWQEAIAAARPILDHAISWVAERHDLTKIQGKTEAAEILLPLLADVADPIQRSHYVELMAQQLHVDARALAERLRNRSVGKRAPVNARASSSAIAATPPAAPHHRDQEYAIALLVSAARRGLPSLELDPGDFSDPAARALLLRIQEITATTPGQDWRPDLLALVAESWLAEPSARVQIALADVERLADAQVTTSAQSMVRQLRDTRLAAELPRLTTLIQDAESDQLSQIKTRISEILQERAALRAHEAESGAGPSALGTRTATIPPRFRSLDLVPLHVPSDGR